MAKTTDKNKEFLELYMTYHNRLGRFIATLVWNREEARDVVSETLLVALENFETLRSREAFLHYLFGIAVRIINKRKRRSWRSLFFDEQGWDSLNNSRGEEDSSDAKDLHRLLLHLNEKSREAIVLYEISGFSIKEISEIQNCSLSGVKSRLVRARETLQKVGRSEKFPVYLNSI
jgi:RNA polymerase sigma-70 factor (ECF subfamily)